MTKDQIIEQSIIGAILNNPKANYDLVHGEGVSVDSFTLEAHKGIFAAMQALVAEGKPLDHATITSKYAGGQDVFAFLV